MSGPQPAPKPARLGPVPRAVVAHAVSFAAGLAAALVFSYVLYRMGLPSKPFIYVAF